MSSKFSAHQNTNQGKDHIVDNGQTLFMLTNSDLLEMNQSEGLYLRSDVEELALSKWKTVEEMKAEQEKRMKRKTARKHADDQ